MAIFLTATTLLLPVTRALQYPSYGASPNGSFPAEGSDLFIAANKAPNASHTVTYDRFPIYYADPDPPGRNWSWTVSTSDVSLPNASSSLPNAHVAYTTYALSWPNDEPDDLRSALQAEDRGGLCAVVVTNLRLPQENSNAWYAAGPDCYGVFDNTCYSTLANEFYNHFRASTDCRAWNISASLDLRQDCASSLFSDQDGAGPGIAVVGQLLCSFVSRY